MSSNIKATKICRDNKIIGYNKMVVIRTIKEIIEENKTKALRDMIKI
jgi:hypothetical protein